MIALAVQSGKTEDFLINKNELYMNDTVDSILNALNLQIGDTCSTIESKIQEKAKEKLNFFWEQYSEREQCSRSSFCKKIGWATTSNFCSYLAGKNTLSDNVIKKIALELGIEPKIIKYDFNHAAFKDFLREKRLNESGLNAEKMQQVARNIKIKWEEYQALTGMTQNEFSRTKLGLKTQASLSQFINARTPVSYELLLKFAKAFSCNVTDLSPDIEMNSQLTNESNNALSDAKLLIKDLFELLQRNDISVSKNTHNRIRLIVNS